VIRRNKYSGLLTLILMFTAVFAAVAPSVHAQTKKQIADAKKIVADGDALYRQKNYQGAIQKYQAAIKLVPNYPYAFFSKGYSHFYLKEYDQAIEDLNTSLTQSYTPIEVYKIRWNAYYDKKDYPNALKDIQEAIKIEPANAAFYISQGDIYREQNLDKEAIDSYTKASELNPSNADLPYFIAVIYAKNGQFPEQGAAALKAIEKGTKYPGEAWLLRGESLQRERKYVEAAEAYERALIAKPDTAETYVNLSNVHQSAGEYDKAIAVTKRGLTIAPENVELFNNLSRLYSLTNKPADAIIAAKQAVRLAPDKYLGYTNLCRAYNDTTQYQVGADQCKKALEINPGDGESNFYLARAYDFQKLTNMATDYYKKAVVGLNEFTKNNPDYPDGYYLLGNAYVAVNDKPNAIGAYRKSLELNPKFAKAIYNLALTYQSSGNKKAAVEQREALQKVDAALADKLTAALSQK
jgi:tetratricopeptide (TPR) repeat protein